MKLVEVAEVKISNCCKKLILRRKLIQAGEEEDKFGATLKVTNALHCITLHIAHCTGALHYIALHFIALYHIAHCTARREQNTSSF